ncbi:hypothetical protein AB0C96_03715 [Streptomyces sp. NPDC048506]|uniref:hypothetical protein n=1 Tax=Streptomyces sp. NPDC048506 TaxID=3155028 RepID=UPI00342D5EED
MSPYRPAPPPYGATPDYVLAPPRAEDRLNTVALPVDLLLPPPLPEDRLRFAPDAEDGMLPPPRPEERLEAPVALPDRRRLDRRRLDRRRLDRRRLDLQAALTAAGIAPADGDAAAVAELAGLSDATVWAVTGWIGSAARTNRPRPHAV